MANIRTQNINEYVEQLVNEELKKTGKLRYPENTIGKNRSRGYDKPEGGTDMENE